MCICLELLKIFGNFFHIPIYTVFYIPELSIVGASPFVRIFLSWFIIRQYLKNELVYFFQKKITHFPFPIPIIHTNLYHIIIVAG